MTSTNKVLIWGGEGGGDSNMKAPGGIVGNFENNHLKGTRTLFCGRGPNNFSS